MARRWHKHPHLWPVLLWTALWALFFSTLLLGLEHLAQSDLLMQFHTFGRFQAQELLAGRFPVWSPGSYGGFPFAADTQAAVFYLPRWFTIFLSAPWDFPYYALELEGLLHIWLLGIFTYFLAHNITHSRWAGLIAAVTFGLGGFITSYPLLQLAILETITWLPLVLLLLRRGVRAKRPLPWLIGAGLTLGLSFLAGHPQTFLHISYLAAFYFFFLTIRACWQWRWLLGLGALVAITAVAVAAAAWLPALNYMQASTRSDVSYEFVAKGFALLDYFQLWLPGPFTVWVPMYVGLPALALVILAWLLRHTTSTSDTKAEIGFWTVAAIIILVLSLGDKGILFELVYRTVPGFSLFRQQERIVSLFSLSMALLAAMGLALWQSSEEAVRKQAIRRLLWIMVGSLLFSGFILAAIKKSDWVSLWLQQGLITAVTLILLWHTKKINWRSLGLVLLLCIDLFLLSRQQLVIQTGSPTVYWPQPEWLTQLQNDDPGRIETQGFFMANVGELHHLEDIRGISPLRPQALDKFEDLSAEKRWQLLNVTHIFSEDAFVDGMIPFTSVDNSVFPNQPFDTTLFRYDNALPRTRMVYQPQLADTDEAAFQLLQQPEFDPAAQVILTAPESDVTAVTPPTTPPTITTTRPSAKELHIQVSTDTPGILIISEWAYPGWQATVNGEPWPLETANYAQQALVLPAGTYDIILRFTPWDVKVGIGISILILLIVLIIAWQWRPIVSIHKRHSFVANRWLSGRKYSLVDKQSSSVSRYAPFLMALLLFWSFTLRLSTTATQDLRGDEAFTVMFARNSLSILDIINRLIDVGETLGPFQYIIIYIWGHLVGDTELALRYMSVLLGLLVLALVAQIGKQLLGVSLALLLLGLLSVSQSMIWVSQDVRSYAWMQFLILASTLLLLYATRDNRQGTGWWIWGVYALTCVLAVYNHYYSAFALIAQGLYIWFEPGKRPFFKYWLCSGLIAGLLFIPYPILLWSKWLAMGHIANPDKPELAVHLAAVGQELVVGHVFANAAGRWLFLLGLATAVWAAIQLYKIGKQGWSLFLLAWLGFIAIGLYLIRFYRGLFNLYYISPATPAWWLLVGVGILLLWRKQGVWRWLSGLFFVALITANLISLSHYYFNPDYNRNSGSREIAAYLSEKIQPGDVFIAHAPDPALEYYLEDLLPLDFQPATFNVPAEDTETALQEIAEIYDRVWFIPYTSFDTENVVGRWLDYHMLNESQTRHQNRPLWAFRPLRTADEAATPVDQMLNGEIGLQLAYITVNGMPASLDDPLPVSSGDALTVSLIWSAQDTIPEDYTVFVHLLADDGSLVGQHDGAPMFATRPTTTWSPNEQLLDRHELVIAETGFVGNGRLLVGMYRPETLIRLPLENGETALELTPVIINP